MFSVIIPSYNRQAEIPALLTSLSQQTVYNFEVIIVDDCSQQRVELTEHYPFSVKIIRNNENKGAAESRNIGAKNANNPWLLFLDDDDRFLPNKCELLAQAIEQNPKVNFIYHPAECEMVNEKFSYFTHPYTDETQITLTNILKANKVGGMPMIAIHRTLFDKVNGLSIHLRSLEDYEFILKIISDETFCPKYIDQALTKCTFHTKRSSVSTNAKYTEHAIKYIEKQYVITAEQKQNFAFNALYMLAYPHIMNLSRGAAKYYFLMFKRSKKIKYLVATFITCLSPKLAINLKRFS